ncbi:hypothetical protein [Flagellimonas flava]|uniref:Uncharacterized protein n=1 Tax=Flagellimonas flava TaxID=570519 RepID=A0A1M5I3J7_9FLAO|nr:hypothetical protein [Allomuricauda flava]SHG22659.1 hypothetical protein SAMN04488116_0397 [Allomuricauda flava]
MKKSVIVFMLVLWNVTFGQEEPKADNLFVRVYDMNGTKIAKGTVVSWSKENLVLQGRKTMKSIPFERIQQVKTKRSAGHNVGVGAIAGASVGGIFGLIIADDDGFFVTTPAENAVGFALVGAVLGSAVGGLTNLGKKSITMPIDGDRAKWESFISGKVSF